jgi:hypothetical protein
MEPVPDFYKIFMDAVTMNIAECLKFREMTVEERLTGKCILDGASIHTRLVGYIEDGASMQKHEKVWTITGTVPLDSLILNLPDIAYGAIFQVSIPVDEIDEYQKYFFHKKLTYENQKEK